MVDWKKMFKMAELMGIDLPEFRGEMFLVFLDVDGVLLFDIGEYESLHLPNQVTPFGIAVRDGLFPKRKCAIVTGRDEKQAFEIGKYFGIKAIGRNFPVGDRETYHSRYVAWKTATIKYERKNRRAEIGIAVDDDDIICDILRHDGFVVLHTKFKVEVK